MKTRLNTLKYSIENAPLQIKKNSLKIHLNTLKYFIENPSQRIKIFYWKSTSTL